jgi:predicted aspartyl protease
VTALFAFTARAADSNVAVTIPITQRHGQIIVPARVNGSDLLSFMLDTGFTTTMLQREIAEKIGLKPVGEITVEGIAGEERSPTYEGAVFDVGGARFSPRRVGAMPATRRQRDGILGSGLFRQYVLCVDVAAKTLAIINPTNFNYTGRGEIVPIRFPRRATTPVVDALIQLTNGATVQAVLEIDTGCDSGVCLGSEFTRTNHLVDVGPTHSGTKVGVGGGTTTRRGYLPALQLGKLKINRPETDFFLEGSPAGYGRAGHIGMDVLKHFRIYFDYSRNRMMLEPLPSAAER